MSAWGLVVFDLDGTLLRGPTVCEVLAEAFDKSEEMAAFEKLSDEKEIALAREVMASWYGDTSHANLLRILSGTRLAPGAKEGVLALQEAGIEVGIASITWRFAAEWIGEQLGISHIRATGLHSSGLIDHVWPRHKAEWLSELSDSLDLPLERTAAIGDSTGDFPMLERAGLPISVGRQLPPQTDWIHMPEADIREVAQVILGHLADCL